jgi:hypothetical protein
MPPVELGVGHRPPRHLAIVAGTGVRCPLTDRPRAISRCRRCRYLQGSLDGPQPCILCAAPLDGAHGRGQRGAHLVFFEDWPEAD